MGHSHDGETDDRERTLGVESLRRRRLLAAGGATWASVSLAGCAALFDDEDPEPDPNEEPVPNTEPEVPNYVVTDDLIAGSAGIPDGPGGFVSACAPQRQYIPGMQPVFKVGVWDPATGDVIGDDVLDAVTVELDVDETIELDYDDEDQEWGGAWIVPEGTAPGTIGFTVQVTNEGEFRRVGILESEFEVIEWDDPRNYVVVSDPYTTTDEGAETEFVQSCDPIRRFHPDWPIGMDVEIYDPAAGEPVGDDVLDIVEVEFTLDGDHVGTIELEFDDPEWNHVWRGHGLDAGVTYDYEVLVTNEDANFHRVGIAEDWIALADI